MVFIEDISKSIIKKCPCSSRPKILIVDDNTFNLVALQSILEITYGIDSEKAYNGQEALDIVT
jgi:PleD family two-component response regulator